MIITHSLEGERCVGKNNHYKIGAQEELDRPRFDAAPLIAFFAEKEMNYETNAAGRVGCFPCINSAKAELAAMFSRWPDVLEKLRHYEHLVAKASKRGQATFFAASTTPQGGVLVKAQKNGQRLSEPLPNIDAIDDVVTHYARRTPA